MATVNPINRPKGQTRGGVCAVLEYAMLPEKTVYEGRQLVTGLNCQPECCYTEFISTKLQYGKCDDKKMYFHFVQSFHPEEPITPEEAHQIALELAEQWKDYEVIVATHIDREHIHSHFIINSVSFESGKKYHFTKNDLQELRDFSDGLCVKHGLSICQPRERQTAGIGQAEYHAALKGESWKIRLAIQIDECMKYAVNREQFIELMESEGYSVKWTDKRKSITYTNPDGLSCRDFKLHEEKYLKENMEYEFKIRARYYDSQRGGSESYAQTALRANLDKASNIQKSITLTEANWTGLTNAVELTRQAVLKQQETMERLISAEQMAEMLKAQLDSLTAEHAGAIREMRSRCAGADGSQRRELGADAADHDGYGERDQMAAGDHAEGFQITGWECQRELLFAALQRDGYAQKSP